MKTEKIIWGLIFIFVGSIFMLDNFNVINFYWSSIWRFWPVIFILIGANMLFSRFVDRATGPLLTAAVTIAILLFIGYQGSRPSANRGWLQFRSDRDHRDRDPERNMKSTFSEPYTGSKMATLNIEGGATAFELKDSTVNLFQADVSEIYEGYTLDKSTVDSADVLNFRRRDKKDRKYNLNDIESNETRFFLNTSPLWNINVNMGAGETDFDLENFRVRRLKFKGGAASFYAKIGSKEPLTDIVVEAGVASVEIAVPESSGSHIVVDSGLSSKDFPGFVKQSDGSYKTPNYDTAVNKVFISLKGGLSSFEVRKY